MSLSGWTREGAAIATILHGNLNWEMFQGPAERGGYLQLKQRDWRRFPQFGGGMITDWGIHLLDVAMWRLHADTKKPLKVSAAAGTFSVRRTTGCRTQSASIGEMTIS